MRNLWLQVAHTSGAKIYSLCVGLVVLSTTARFLGPDGRGVVVAATAWATMFATIGGLSLGQVAIYKGAGQDPLRWLKPTIRTMVLYLIAVSLAGWLFASIAYAGSHGSWFPNTPWLALAIALFGFPALVWTDYATSLLMAVDSLRTANVAQVIGSTFNAGLVILLLFMTPLGIYAPLIAVAVAGLVTAAYTGRALLAKAGRNTQTEPGHSRAMLTAGLKLHANALGTFLFAQASLLVVNYYRTKSDTAFYGLALQLIAVANIIPTAIGMVAYTLVGRHGPDRAWREQRKLLGQGALLALCIIVAGYILAPLGIRIVAGKAFLPAVAPFRLVLPALVGMTFSSVMASQWIGRGFFSRAAGITICLGVVNIGTTLALVPRFGMTGAAAALVVTYTLAIIINGGLALWVERRVREVAVA